MKTLAELHAAKAETQEQLSKINSQITERLSETIIQCQSNINGSGCGMGFQIKELTYLQTHWYESPHGCTGGDNWHRGEGNFICPKCGLRNRLYDRVDIQALKMMFKDVVDEHDD